MGRPPTRRATTGRPSSTTVKSGLLWQAKAGLEIKTGTPISFDLGYRYMGTPEYHQDASES